MRLPPLNALRAFEAATRHGGYIGASEELHVTRGAISRHVKLLEQHLGLPLFIRHPQGVQLTAQGARLLQVLSDAFKMIAREADRIESAATDLRIICPPATSIRWLIPKLEGFRDRHPDIRLRLTTDYHGGSGFDAAEYDIGFSVENWPGRNRSIEVMNLFPILLTPACAPQLLADKMLIGTPQDLSKLVLLHETPQHADWTAWVTAFDIQGLDPRSGDDFPNLDIATKAAVMGTGAVMSDLVLCREELEAGTLVAPFQELTCKSPYGAVCIIGAREKWREPKVQAFKAWVAEMAAKELDRLPV